MLRDVVSFVSSVQFRPEGCNYAEAAYFWPGRHSSAANLKASSRPHHVGGRTERFEGGGFLAEVLFAVVGGSADAAAYAASGIACDQAKPTTEEYAIEAATVSAALAAAAKQAEKRNSGFLLFLVAASVAGFV